MAFLQIIINNILPLMIFISIGYTMDKVYGIDVLSLNKLTFYVVLPCFIFYSIYVAQFNMTMVNVFLLALTQMMLLGVIGWLISKARGFDEGKTEALKNGVMFSNNGNIGIAVIALVFGNAPYIISGKPIYLAEALAASTMMLVQMNLFLNTLGLYQAGKGKLTTRDALSVIFHMPVVYTLAAVFCIKFSGFDMTQTFIWPVLENCAAALVAIVMISLGAQISRAKVKFGDIDAWIGTFIRLIFAPFLAFLLILLWGRLFGPFDHVIAQTILIMCSIPSGVNTVLYAVEFHNYEDFATEIVMMTTILSGITMAAVIYLARVLFPL